MRGLKKRWPPGKGLAVAIPILMTLTCVTEATAKRKPLCLLEISVLGTGAALLCEQPTAKTVTDTSCKAFEPIRYSRKDTGETVRQAREHNAAWDALCKKK